jgi:hypothetical protein
MNDEIEVQAIHRGNGVALLACGCSVPITDWFGKDGEDCAPKDAIVCVGGDDDHGWFMIDLVALEIVTVH